MGFLPHTRSPYVYVYLLLKPDLTYLHTAVISPFAEIKWGKWKIKRGCNNYSLVQIWKWSKWEGTKHLRCGNTCDWCIICAHALSVTLRGSASMVVRLEGLWNKGPTSSHRKAMSEQAKCHSKGNTWGKAKTKQRVKLTCSKVVLFKEMHWTLYSNLSNFLCPTGYGYMYMYEISNGRCLLTWSVEWRENILESIFMVRGIFPLCNDRQQLQYM